MTIEEHINGLKGIKPYLQKKMLEINYEGLGELDALQVGETMDFAIESIRELETYKKELIVLRKAYELMADEFITGCRVRCFESHDEDCSERFGCSDWEICGTKENAKAYFIDKAMEELKNET